jgi:hypothetical protein
MQSRIIAIVSQLAEVGLFFAAAAALGIGLVHLR